MYPIYEAAGRELTLLDKAPGHIPPHLHQAVEFVYVVKETLELGVGKELYHMEAGDFGVVFPNRIHHYQAFGGPGGRALFLLAPASMLGPFGNEWQQSSPRNPVIRRENVPADIVNAVYRLFESKKEERAVRQAYVQILFAKAMARLELEEERGQEDADIVYQCVCYISEHFRETITMPKMAKALGVGSYVLSRVFSGIFHRNFNQYLNETRFNYACSLLIYTDRPVTEVCMEAGFESQRTFNRVFRQFCHMTPREYRREMAAANRSAAGGRSL